MNARTIGLLGGALAFALTLALPAPAGMPPAAWPVAGLVLWMAAWWMTEAVPLTVTALLPFIVVLLVVGGPIAWLVLRRRRRTGSASGKLRPVDPVGADRDGDTERSEDS